MTDITLKGFRGRFFPISFFISIVCVGCTAKPPLQTQTDSSLKTTTSKSRTVPFSDISIGTKRLKPEVFMQKKGDKTRRSRVTLSEREKKGIEKAHNINSIRNQYEGLSSLKPIFGS